MMDPTAQFYFGSQDKKRFGVYHPAADISPALPAVLICNPLGGEAVTAHRLLRVLAIRLAEAGMPVLRFDYYGCGDSAGADEDFTLAGAMADIQTAHQELLDRMASHRRIIWLGIRFGATLAFQAAAAIARRGPRQLVLWDCIVDGEAYLAQLRAAHIAALSRVMDLSAARVVRKHADDLDRQIMGFSLPDALIAEIKQVSLSTLFATKPARPVMILESAGGAGGTGLIQAIDQHKSLKERIVVDEEIDWLTHNTRDPLYLPYTAIKLLTGKLAASG